jgi:cytolysin (calcineurin-like family phosphatase)
MKTLTNYTAGARGINLKSGGTRWLEPGETAEIDPKEIVGPLPDLGKKADQAAADTGEVDALRSQVDSLTTQLADSATANTALLQEVEALKAAAKK